MQTGTISPAGYTSFFDSLSRIYHGSSATLDLLADDIGALENDAGLIEALSIESEGDPRAVLRFPRRSRRGC